MFGKAKAKVYDFMKKNHNSKALSSLILENLQKQSSGPDSTQILPSVVPITN